MYKISTLSKSLVSGAVLSLALFSANTFAGPGKPGKNGIKDGGNIVDVAVEANALLGEFDYLLGAVGCFTDEETGYNPIVDLLTGSDKLTLFAPTDAAFENLQGVLGVPEEDRAPEVTCAVDSILGEGTLFTVLAYHLTDGRRFSNSVFNQNNSKQIDMLAGGYITTNASLTIIDGFPQVITPQLPLIDINASNGVIHVIDTVMLPFNPFAGEE
jgi:uncharacterized surface protein with fasciclin (FAS1) repeats